MIIFLLASIFILTGTAFFAIAALGLLRFPDVYCRMHAASKASSFGMGLLLIGINFQAGDLGVAIKSLLTITFIFLTTPVAAHLLGRSAYLSGSEPTEGTFRTEVHDLYHARTKNP